MGADEGDFLELLIANQRILEWIDQLKATMGPQKSVQRRKHIIMQLKTTVEEKAAYAEEAQRLGAVQVLTSILRSTDDDEVMDAISAIISACSGPMASGGKVSDFKYGNASVRIREGALGDGLGAKVWTVAHMLCRVLAEHPDVVQGHTVLEIGAGCGVCGIVAAKLGALRVDLTDVEGPVLRNLRDCVHLNSAGGKSSIMAVDEGHTPNGQCLTSLQPKQPLPLDADLFDDAESVDGDLDLGSLMIGEDQGVSPGGKHLAPVAGVGHHEEAGKENTEGREARGLKDSLAAAGIACQSDWEAGNMCVRLLDWLESLHWQQQQQRLQQHQQPCIGEGVGGEAVEQPATDKQPRQAAPQLAASYPGPVDNPSQFYANDLLRMEDNGPLQGEVPPKVDLHKRYPRIIGTDIMYEPMHAILVAAVLAHRLEPGGGALLCCAVRQIRTFVAFEEACTAQGLRYRWLQVEPGAEEQEGIGGRRNEYDKYEGGFLLMAVDRYSQPCYDWGLPDALLAGFSSRA